MPDYKQFVFRIAPKWYNTCSCGNKEESNDQQTANEKNVAHIATHSEVSEIELSDARSEFFEAHSSLNHVGSGMADRLRRFHAAWSNLNFLKKKVGQPTVTVTKPRVK